MEASLAPETGDLLEHHIHLGIHSSGERAGFFPSPWASPLSDLGMLVFSQLSHVRRARGWGPGRAKWKNTSKSSDSF